MLTKQHFKELAEIFKESQDHNPYAYQSHIMWERLKEHIMKFCTKYNPRFDREKFEEACRDIK